MSESTSLYRRHRPGSFDEVVGQTHVVRTLRNAVEQGKVHHAYLFVGSRGTGKTSMAKILARSLNCERGGPTVTPCGECESCVTIAAGTSVDVIEMDAASNRSVDDVRDLRERVAYAPAGGHWKVYILDEAHMLTKEAWNAFLKTLEEPPPNTVFVLATTESHKVMGTIADRCQRFDFQRPSLEQISEVLNRVATAESIEVDDGAVAMIARSASGSFRDALGTLDQLVAFGGSRVELSSVLEMLGAADAELLFETIDAVIAEDPKQVLLGIERMARSGRDPSQFARDLLAHLRHLLIVQTTGEVPTTFVVTATDTGRMQAQAQAIKPANLIRTIDELATALTAVREGDDARMAVEIALLKAARPDLDPNTAGLLRRIERLEQGGTARPAGPAAAGDPPSPATTQETVPPTTSPTGDPPSQATPPPAEPPAPPVDPPPADEEEAESPQSGNPAPPAGGDDADPSPVGEGAVSETGPAGQTAPVPADLSLEEIQRVWPAVLHKLQETAPALAATLEGARPISFGDEGLEVAFPTEMTFLKKKAEGADRRDTVAAAFAAVTGVGLRPTYVLLDGEAPPDTPAPGSEEIDEEELLERLKSEFDAEEVS
ncbi:MAG TPA: DNA polymerase III subunit gamma/tau [Solirubrobacterales bacterium]|nr:DNA polymerase III subunit gamma/tau [Solirubrobacterales bacterium]